MPEVSTEEKRIRVIYEFKKKVQNSLNNNKQKTKKTTKILLEAIIIQT